VYRPALGPITILTIVVIGTANGIKTANVPTVIANAKYGIDVRNEIATVHPWKAPGIKSVSRQSA